MGTRQRKARSAEGARTASAAARDGAEMANAGGGVAGPSPGHASHVVDPAYGTREVCERARTLYWRLTGRAMRQDPETGLGRFEWMAESEEDIGVVERRAARVCGWQGAVGRARS